MSTVLSFVDQLLADSGGEVEWGPQRDRIEALVPEEFHDVISLYQGRSSGIRRSFPFATASAMRYSIRQSRFCG